jgi:hypothetical protein
MSLRRGFLRLWIVATGIWIGGWAWHYAAICRDFDGLVFISGFNCNEKITLTPPIDEPVPHTGYVILGPAEPELRIGAIQMGITLIGVPLGILATGWLAAWVIWGFRLN